MKGWGSKKGPESRWKHTVDGSEILQNQARDIWNPSRHERFSQRVSYTNATRLFFSLSWVFDGFFSHNERLNPRQFVSSTCSHLGPREAARYANGGANPCQTWLFLHHRFAMVFSCEMKRGDSENSGNLWSQNVINDIVGLSLATPSPLSPKKLLASKMRVGKRSVSFGGPAKPCGFRSLALSFRECTWNWWDDCSSSSMLYVTVNVWFLFSFDIFRRVHRFCSYYPSWN